jgi:hypothetical protein
LTALPAARTAGPFSSLAVLWMVVVGCISALLFLVLTAYAPSLRSESNGGAHAMSKSAVGFAGLVKLLGDEGVPAIVSRDSHPSQGQTARLLVLTPDLDTDPKAIDRLGGSAVELIVLPKWLVGADPHHPGWVMRGRGVADVALAQRVLNGLDHTDHLERRNGITRPKFTTTGAYFDKGGWLQAGPMDGLQTIVGPDQAWLSVAETEPGHAILIKKADAPVFILSDPDLLNNQGLADLGDARVASILIDGLRLNRPVAFDLTLAGFTRSRSLLGLAFEPPFLAATLCAIAAAALMGLHAAARFGPALRPAPAFALGKRALADNSAALIRLARRQYRMGAGYAVLTRGLAARAVGAPRELDDDQMDALLDRLGRIRGTGAAFSDLERQARDARDPAALMVAAHKLYQWRLEMTHEHR